MMEDRASMNKSENYRIPGAIEKKLEKKNKELEFVNLNYKILKERVSILERNSRKLIDLIESGLDMLGEDEFIKKKNDFTIDLNTINDKSFDDLGKEKKYGLLCLAMKHLMSIIVHLNLEDDKQKKNIYFSDIRFNFSKNKMKENVLLKNTLLTLVKSPNRYLSVTKPLYRIELPKLDKIDRQIETERNPSSYINLLTK